MMTNYRTAKSFQEKKMSDLDTKLSSAGAPSPEPKGFPPALYTCTECGSTELRVTAWVTLNGDRILADEPPTDQVWCNNCETDQAAVKLVVKTEEELLKTKNFGRRCLNEVNANLKEKNLTLGMTLSGLPHSGRRNELEEKLQNCEELSGDSNE